MSDQSLMNPCIRSPLYMNGLYCVGGTYGVMQRRCFGRAAAVVIALMPSHDDPNMPMRPLHHGCSPAQSTIAAISRPCSQPDAIGLPNDAPVPRRSITTTA